MAREFCNQLKELQENFKGGATCIETLNETISSLAKIREDLLLSKPMQSNPDQCLVEIGAVNGANYPIQLLRKEDIQKGINNVFVRGGSVPCLASLLFEDNFRPDKHGLVEPVREAFLDFKTDEHAAMILGLGKLKVINDGMHLEITLLPVSRPATLRKTWRTIGQGIARLKEIKAEYERMGAKNNTSGPPEPSDEIIDKSVMSDVLQQMKNRRAETGSYAYHDRAYLALKPVDMASIKGRLAKLYDDEVSIMIQLRQFQLDGVEFVF